MPTIKYSDEEAARSLVAVIVESKWEAVGIAHGFLAARQGKDGEAAARQIFEHGTQSLKRSRELIALSKKQGFLKLLSAREKIGSAENPITKLFPAAITEQRFIDLLDELKERHPALEYTDDRKSSHTLTDFTLVEDALRLPLNIKNAGTRFERAQDLVGLAPDDCLPIPAYKAHRAIETVSDLLYVVSVDYGLVHQLDLELPKLFNPKESIVWELLNKSAGARVQNAEDLFVFSMVNSPLKKSEKVSLIIEP